MKEQSERSAERQGDRASDYQINTRRWMIMIYGFRRSTDKVGLIA